VRLDRKATAISLLIVLGVRRDGQKVVLAIRKLGGESKAASRAVLDDLLAGGMARPERVSWSTVARASRRRSPVCGTTCRCSAAPSKGAQPAGPRRAAPARRDQGRLQRHGARQDRRGGARERKQFLAKWRLRCRAIADSLEEAGERLFTFLRATRPSSGAR
jgi:putative transposase